MGRSIGRNMQCALFLVLFASVASAEHYQAWKTDTEYQYVVRGRTLAALHDVSNQYSGIKLKALLTVQPKSGDTLQAKVSKAQYARIHTNLPDGWKSEIPDNMVDFKQLPLSEKVFEVKMSQGVVQDLIVDKSVPTWEVNILKSIVSQLQVDTQGQNLMPSRYNQEPEDDRVNSMYKTMEDSVSGKCEVLYDISPLPDYRFPHSSEQSAKAVHLSDEEAINIVKTKNFSKCEQRMSYHFGIAGSTSLEPFTNGENKYLSRSSISRIIVTGNLKAFTIHSSVTTDVVIVSPNFNENQKGMVGSKVNVTLVKMGPASSGPWSTSSNPESTGDLVYNYNNPFAGPGEDRRPGQHSSSSDVRNVDEHSRFADNQEDESSAPDDLNNGDSRESNEEQQWYWQPKPNLNEAPSIPLLPFFVGNRGKSLQNSGNVDSVAAVKGLASQIGRDLQNPNTISEEQTLEKFSILARILRTMNAQQIAEAQSELYQSSNQLDPHNESQSVRRSTWVAFRDAVAQAGTGPALIAIRNWLKEKKIRGIEAASVVDVLPKTARTPTPEYMDAFFQMVTMPETANEEFLNASAMISFAELIRFSQVDDASAHNRYPVHSFGRLSPKYNPAVMRDYIPHMEEQLREAIEKKESAKAHVLIHALGATAHPKVLAVFEPHLEGKSQASTFQRLLMVMSLNELASLNPRLARGVLYRIYQNNAEAHQIRCAAVTLLVSTNPPASMLQRIAEFTNYDHSKQVNAAVKSAIETASELTEPESQDLAIKAKNVRFLLNHENYGFEYSKNYLVDYGAGEMNLASRLYAAQIGSRDSFIPQAVFASIKSIYGDVEVPKLQIGAMVSSIKDLYDACRERSNDEKESSEHQESAEFSPEKIAKLLKLEPRQSNKLEGAMWMNSPWENKIFSFDDSTVRHINDIWEKASASLKDGANMNVAKIVSNDMTLSFPMESGLPFIYTLKNPVLLKWSGLVKGDSNPESVEGSADLQIVNAVQHQSRFGFVTPFEHQHYSAGVNQNYHVYLPVRAKLMHDKSKKRVTLELQPRNQNEEHRIVEFSTVPFTSRHDILSVSPVTKDKDTHQIRRSELSEKSSDLGSRTHGLNLRWKSEWDTDTMASSNNDVRNKNVFVRLIAGSPKENIAYSKTEISLIPNQSSSQSVILTASFEAKNGDLTSGNRENNDQHKAKALQVSSKKFDDPDRRRQLLNEVAEGIDAADAWAIDWGVEFPGQEPLQFISTFAYANSKVDDKSQGRMYFRVNSGKMSTEFCSALKSTTSTASIFEVPMAEKSPRRSNDFDIEIRDGDTCETGTKIRIIGHQKQSDHMKQAIAELPSASKCAKEIKAGMKLGAACQKVSDKLSTMDQTQVSIIFEPKDRSIKEVFEDYIEMLSNLDDTITIQGNDNEVDENRLELSMIMGSSENHGSFSYASSNKLIHVPDIDTSSFADLFENADLDMPESDNLIDMSLSDVNAREQMCVIEANSARTFDQASYSQHLGKCWHVALTSTPESRQHSQKDDMADEYRRLAVLVRDDDSERKEVKMILKNAEIDLKEVDNNIRVTANGKDIDLHDKSIHREPNNEDPDFEIIRHSDESVQVISAKNGIDVSYNGRGLGIKASGMHRNDLRGLCGNYDGEPDNDLTSPKNCIMRNSNEFVASFALSTNDCQGQAKELSNQVRANEGTCHRSTVQPDNVVSEREAGRSNQSPSKWGRNSKNGGHRKNQNVSDNRRCTAVRTKIIEEENDICFSLRPVPTCADGCKATRSKFKVMPMHCIPRGSAAKKMADLIKQGANPDLSQKEMSKKLSFNMPVSCEAA